MSRTTFVSAWGSSSITAPTRRGASGGRWRMRRYAIRGNHDHAVAQGIPAKGGTGYRYLTSVSRPLVWDALGHDERRDLLQLPLTQRVLIDGHRFLLVHATPRDPLDEYLMKDPETWAKRIKNTDVDIVCVGHSHMQFNLAVDGVAVVNPGSVGQPRDGDLRGVRGDRGEPDRVEAGGVSGRGNDRPSGGPADPRVRQAVVEALFPSRPDARFGRTRSRSGHDRAGGGPAPAAAHGPAHPPCSRRFMPCKGWWSPI